MDSTSYIDRLSATPQIKALVAIPQAERRDMIRDQLPVSLNRVINRYEFDFLEAEHIEASVTGQAEYELRGKADDARTVKTIRYANGKLVLTRLTKTMDEVDQSNVTSSTDSPYAWVPFGKRNGFPLIFIVGAPSVDGDDILYRYIRKNISIKEFPDEWAHVIDASVLDMLFEGTGRRFQRVLREMIDHHQSNVVETQTATQDTEWIKRNRQRNILHGFGGRRRGTT